MNMKLSLLLCMISITSIAVGQNEPTDQSLVHIHELRNTIIASAATPWACDLNYRMADYANPNRFIDSSRGATKNIPGSSWYRMSGMEVLQDSSMSIVVFEDDRLIYMSKSNNLQTNVQSVALLDSIISGSVKGICLKQNHQQTVEFKLVFDEPTIYREVSYRINRDGILVGVRQVLNQFAVGSDIQQTGIPDAWIVLDIQFENWRKIDRNDPAFNKSTYFYKGDEGFVASEKYPNYSVFIANPSL